MGPADGGRHPVDRDDGGTHVVWVELPGLFGQDCGQGRPVAPLAGSLADIAAAAGGGGPGLT